MTKRKNVKGKIKKFALDHRNNLNSWIRPMAAKPIYHAYALSEMGRPA